MFQFFYFLCLITLYAISSVANEFPLIAEKPLGKITIKVSTWNIRWYGLGGESSGEPTDEYRDRWISEFSKSSDSGNLHMSDIIALQEIVDVHGIKAHFPQHHCMSYEHFEKKHQHVVLCIKKPLSLRFDGGDSDFAMEALVSPLPDGKLRPAVHGLLVDAKGKNIAHLIAVHLKAHADFTLIRLQQTKLLKEFVEQKINDGIPVILLGDFNTHIAEKTGLEKDDQKLISEVLSQRTNPLFHVENPFPFTFRINELTGRLDHFWISQGLTTKEGPFVNGACQERGENKKRYGNNAFYNRFLSDHCPVNVVFEVSTNF